MLTSAALSKLLRNCPLEQNKRKLLTKTNSAWCLDKDIHLKIYRIIHPDIDVMALSILLCIFANLVIPTMLNIFLK